MILSSSCDSVFESMYLHEDLTPYMAKAEIVVNPIDSSIMDKTIILSMPCNFIDELTEYNKVISRFPTEDPKVEFIPYEDKFMPIALLKKSQNLYSVDNYKTIEYALFNSKLMVTQGRFRDTEVDNNLTFLGQLNKYLSMNLNTYVGACLLNSPYDSFAYVRIIPDQEEDIKFTEFVRDRFLITNDIFNNLHASKISNERFETFKSQALKTQGINLVQWNYPYGPDGIRVSRMTDSSTTIYTVESKSCGNWIIY